MAKLKTGDALFVERPLCDAIVTLAQTPDHISGIDQRLAAIAGLAAERVAAVSYASVTALRGEEYTAVAATSDLALAVDEAQFADRAGPCLEALHTGEPVGVPSTAATMNWPGFHRLAPELGLLASVSIPLHMGRGVPVAALNLYGRDHVTMEPLIAGVAELYASRRELTLGAPRATVTDPGAEELLDGYAEALAVRATIQLAITLLARRMRAGADDAYAALCVQAGEAGVPMDAAATTVLRERW